MSAAEHAPAAVHTEESRSTGEYWLAALVPAVFLLIRQYSTSAPANLLDRKSVV